MTYYLMRMIKTNHMKRITIFVLSIFSGLVSMAQFPTGGAGGRGQSAPNIGHIYGKIVDSAGKPVSDATVILLQNKFDSVSKKRKRCFAQGFEY